MQSQHLPSAIGTVGVIGTLSLGDINTVASISVALFTLVYLGIRIWKEIKPTK